MADTAAAEEAPVKQQLCGVCSSALSGDKPAACAHNVCGSCLEDKSKGCPQCQQSSGKSEPAYGQNQNGAESEAHTESNTEQEIKIKEDLNEEPKSPEEKKTEEEVKEEEVKEEPLGPDDVVCDSCIESPRRALKSCLTCLVSYCETHLRPHLENTKFQNHRLVEPLRDIERRTCETHKWPLELFCSTDTCCICQDCVMEDHRGHNTVPVLEARRQIEASVSTYVSRIVLFSFYCNMSDIY